MVWSVRLQARLRELELNVELSGAEAPLALIGPNGSGKTTILRMIAGVVSPDDGVIAFDGHTVFDSVRNVCEPPEHRRVGYLPQGYGLFPHLSVLENVAFGLRAQKLANEAALQRATDALTQLGCEPLAKSLVQHLSGGERQRVALARALVTEPRMLLLDEPLAALDVAIRRTVREFLAEHLRARNCPAIITTHDVRDVITLGCNVCVLERGKVVQSGSVDELRNAPVNAFVAEFVSIG